mmetsp:Transcript_19608/g.38507  ORF Transcript_19608/g.38507 Transcript_19608/m.38507 type:complete len:222 (-) Transcript_19608:159-824(-)
MAAVAQQTTSPYAAFLELPSVAALSSASNNGGGLPPRQIAVAEELTREKPGPRPSAAAIELARKSMQDHSRWTEAQVKEDAARLERRELLNLPDTAFSPPPRATPAAAPKAAASKAAPPKAPAENIELRPGEVALNFHLPDGRQVMQHFGTSQSAFDVYSKAYELLHDKNGAFRMTVTGPQRAEGFVPNIKDRAIDEGAWSFDLNGLGLRPGRTYVVKVMQ